MTCGCKTAVHKHVHAHLCCSIGIQQCKVYSCAYLYLIIFLSNCVSVCLSVCLSVCQSVWLSVCLSVWLSVCLSVCQYLRGEGGSDQSTVSTEDSSFSLEEDEEEMELSDFEQNWDIYLTALLCVLLVVIIRWKSNSTY